MVFLAKLFRPRIGYPEPGGWVVVDRSSGRGPAASLPEFDPLSWPASWYRDDAAYCGVSEDSKQIDLMVVQLGRRKPLLRKASSGFTAGRKPSSACPAPTWFPRPMRVEFDSGGEQKLSFSPRRVLDLLDG